MAVEFSIAIGAKISEYLVEPLLIRPLRPILCFGSIVADFQGQHTKLSAIKQMVENDVQGARDNARVIYNNVESWVNEVNDVMPIAQGMLDELSANNKSCFPYSWCPNWTCHYSFSKKVLEITVTMKTLCATGESFNNSVSHPPTLHQYNIASSSSAPFMHSQSSKSAFDQIMVALNREDVNLIGLYGGVGTGKTTLAKQVDVEAKAKDIFRRVILVPLSTKPDVKTVQGSIADFLGLSLEHLESDEARATILQRRLKNGEMILIILDDVSKDFNLGAVGIIPSVGCKLLLTAHTKLQVPDSMHTQKDVELGTLLQDEAWTLFESVAGVGNEVRMHDVAKVALAECRGLPKAVVAIGTALNGKGVPEWAETLQQLQECKFKILHSLKEDAQNLNLMRERVNTKITTARQNVHEIYPDVEKWLNDVERVLTNVKQFENEINLNKWYFDERDVENKVEVLHIYVKDLHAKGNFDQVSHPTPHVQDMGLFQSEEFMFSKAAKSTCAQIMEAMETDGVNMIGMYGMGGVGKTTLAYQVHEEVVRRNIFKHAVMVTVSQKPDVGNMQNTIAKVLGFNELTQINDSLDERASKLKLRLKDEKILIILDDVWKWFDLRSIGIMLNDCKACKVLFTTRRKDVCSSMNCQQEIQLDLLSEEESQIFFKTKAGLSCEFVLDDVAKQIVEECKCLPIALETVGAALKNKGKDEWTEALGKLRNAKLVDIMGVYDDDKNAYKCVKLSYDYLKGPTQTQQAQFILLLCSIFPEDYKIEVEDLASYAFGMKLFERVSSVEDARRKVRVAVRFLIDSCLLLDVGDEEYVKIHDVVRDTVLWIGGTEAQEKKVLTVRDNEDLKELINKESFQNCRAVSFMSDVIPKLSKYSKLECPNLEIVLIFKKGGDVELGEGFFENMQVLKVLDMKGGDNWTKCKFAMPQSLHRLEYLRTLMLRYYKCSNSCILRELRSLRILSLNGCEIDGGVEVVSGLKKLRLLDLVRLKAETISFSSNVIERFNKLEELYGYRVENRVGSSSNLSELMLLSNLVALFVIIKDERWLPTNSCFQDLTNYSIRVGETSKERWEGMPREWEFTSKEWRQTRTLDLVGIKYMSVWISTCKKLLPTVKYLSLINCQDLCSLNAFNSSAEGFLQRLESLVVEKCDIMEWVFDFQQLKRIWKGPTRLGSLCNLTQVEIYNCKKLISIFSSPSLATSMQQLEVLTISHCPNLEEIISIKGGSDDDDDFSCCCCFTNLTKLEVFYCENVKTLFSIVKSTGRAPHLHPQSCCRLPKLQQITLRYNFEMEHIFGHHTEAEEGVRVECPSLEDLEVTDCPNISTTHFVATKLQEAPSPQPLKADSTDNIQGLEQRQHNGLSENTIICSSALRRVWLSKCNKLKQVFTTTLVTNLCQLEVLVVEECNELEQVISKVEDGKEEHIIDVCFQNLETLTVSKCRKLKTIFPITIALPKLETLELKSNAELEHVFGQSNGDYTWPHPFLKDICVEGCPKMCTQFAAAIIQKMSIAKAENISLDDIKGVEEIMQIERQKDNDIDEFVTCELFSMILRNLVDLECIWRGPTHNICFEWLCRLKVIGCNKLKYLLETTALPRLTCLTVKRCNELEQVIVMADNGKEKNGDANGVAFRKLTTLEVSECEKLKTIFTISVALPKLETLKLKRNEELEHVFGQSDWDLTSQSPFLEDLLVVGCPKMCTQRIQNLSTAKKEMETIRGVEESDLLRIPLETLVLWNVEELTCIWGGPTLNIWFRYLGHIQVIGCNRLKHIFATPIATSLPCLEKLIVRRCNELEQVIMVGDGKEEREADENAELIVEVGFENLKVLNVSDCETLKTIFTTSIPLPKLDCVRLESNAELESLFGQSDCDYTSHWTGLKQLAITGCPKLSTHSIAIIKCQLQPQSTAKNLEMINLSNIQGVEEIVRFQGQDDEREEEEEKVQILKLEEVRDLKRIWSGPTQNISFSFVGAMRVIGCNRLKQLFTTTMATSLGNLFLLSVERCHELEHVIQEEEEDGNEENNLQSHQQLELPKLKLLRLLDSPNLVSFCPSSCNLLLPHLTEMGVLVKGCPKLVTDCFSQKSDKQDDEDEDEDEEEDEDDNNQGLYYSDRSKRELMEELMGISSWGEWL